jgi:PTH1 family peptidyl-tRNA hydrolase
MDTPLLIAGLGNPGSQYARNRHNAGFIVADELHAHYKFGPWKAKFDGLLSEGVLAGRKTYLLKPQTYMNLSGVSVSAVARFFRLEPAEILVVCDDVALPTGRLRIRLCVRARRAAMHSLSAGRGMGVNMHAFLGLRLRLRLRLRW